MLGRRLKQNFRQYFLNAKTPPLLPLSNFFRLSSPLVVVQCNSYGSLNARRFARILQLYKKLYDQKSVYTLLEQLSLRFPLLTKSYDSLKRFFSRQSGTLLSASIFSFSLNGIADEEMIELQGDIIHLRGRCSNLELQPNLHNFYQNFRVASSFTDKQASTLDQDSDNQEQIPNDNKPTVKHSLLNHEDVQNWELVSEKEHLTIWRRKRIFSEPSSSNHKSALYEYKCAGRYTDVPAYGFLVAQMDLEYRKKWDHLVVCLDVVECDMATGSEVIRWVTHFPYPMCPREYVYVRRACLDPINKCIILTSKTVNHPKCPRQDQKYVRVEEYFSSMIIKPHEDFTKDGFDYVLTYYDDPKAPFPSLAYNWMVTTGVPNFVQKVYKAAKALPIEKDVDLDHGNLEHEIHVSRKIPLTTDKIFDLPILRRKEIEKLDDQASTLELDVENSNFDAPKTKKSGRFLADFEHSCLLYG